MRVATRIALAVGTIMLISGGVASGGSAINIKAALANCQNSDIAPEARIEACSALVHSNLVSHRMLARFHFLRAVAYQTAKKFDLALQDYSKAIELDPNFPEAVTNFSQLKKDYPELAPAPAEKPAQNSN